MTIFLILILYVLWKIIAHDVIYILKQDAELKDLESLAALDGMTFVFIFYFFHLLSLH